MPKRSTSARGPCVCIISMAQQARPKSIHHTDDLRVQLRKASASLLDGRVVAFDGGRSHRTFMGTDA